VGLRPCITRGQSYYEHKMPFTEQKLSDTGYMTETGPCPAFKEIGEKYGPFDVAMVPIWRGGSLSFISAIGLRVRVQIAIQVWL
jgi:hypothetical protein